MDNNVKKRAKEILEKMSLKEKIGQLSQFKLTNENFEQMKKTVSEIHPGSLILCNTALGGEGKQDGVSENILDELQKMSVEGSTPGIPMLYGRDIIHGYRVVLPVPLTLTASFDFELIEQCYDAIREEAVSDGINWTFAPMLDRCIDPRWGRIVEGSGEDPYLGELLAKSIIKGFQTEDVSDEGAMVACAKHFAGYGASEGGRDYNHTEISDYTMQNYILPAFRSAVDSGVSTVMCSFNEIGGVPVTGNKKMLTDILRKQLGFEGFVVSDWEAVSQLCRYNGFCENCREAAKSALSAGCDMDMISYCYLENLESLVESGEMSEDVIDTAVLRILETKLKAGLFEHPYIKKQHYNVENHLSLAKKLAEESIVLLKNENGILPLSEEQNVGLAGCFLESGEELIGSWAGDYDISYSKGIYRAFADVSNNVSIVSKDEFPYYRRYGGDCFVVVLGEPRNHTGEAHSLSDISVPNEQIELVKKIKKLGKPVIGVFCFARPVAFGEYTDLFDAILYAGHGGSCAAEAIVNVIYGKAEPRGRLPFTLPYNNGQIPLYYNALPGARNMNGYYDDGKKQFFNNYDDAPGYPAFPFGYGLSYTEFSVSAPSCEIDALSREQLKNGDDFKITVDVKNTGLRSGIANIQLYVRDLYAMRIRPIRALRSFKTVELKANEQTTLEFRIGLKDLGYYLENGDFVIEEGKFDIHIGENCLTENKISVNVKK